MKFLAILRDSLREIIDAKVFYVMVVLSVLVIFLVASTSFRPVTVEEEVRRLTDRMTWMTRQAVAAAREKVQEPAKKDDLPPPIADDPLAGIVPPTVTISDFEQSAPGEPWKSSYSFHFNMNFADPALAGAVKLTRQFSPQQVTNVLQAGVPWLEGIEVKDREDPDPKTLSVAVTVKGTRIKNSLAWPYEARLFFGSVPLSVWHVPRGVYVGGIMNGLVNTIGAGVAMLVSCVITAFFIPNMLRKGTVDLLLAKPIHRTTLLVYKFVGGLLFMFINTAIIVVGIWLSLGLRTNLWVNSFLLSIFVLTFEFAIFYAFSTLVGVLTRSAIVAILLSCVLWFILWLVGNAYQFLEVSRKIDVPEGRLPEWVYTSVDAIHFVLPRMKDLDLLNNTLVSSGMPHDAEEDPRIQEQVDKFLKSFKWGENLTASGIFIVVVLGLASWRFATRDY